MPYFNLFAYIKNNLETKVFLFFSLVFVFVFYNLSFLSLWTETEIYPIHTSPYLFTSEASHFLFALKPIFYFVLYLSSLFSNLFGLFPMTMARFLFALNGLAILALLYFYIKQKTSKYNAILAVLILASSNIFLDRGFRIRSDLLCASLSLFTLLWLLNVKRYKEDLKFYLTIPLLFSLLLITPKGVYWIFITLCLIFCDLNRNQIPSLKHPAIVIVSTGISFIGISVMFGDPLFLQTLKSSTQFFLLNIQETWQFIFENGWLQSLTDISHVGSFLERNLLLVLLIVAKCAFVVYATMVAKKRPWDLSDLYFGLLILILFFHPQAKFFFLCAITPFFLIAFFTDYQWKQLLSKHYSSTFKTFLLVGAFLYSGFYITYFNSTVYTKKNNRPQKELVEKLNHFYKHTDLAISIFDPTCLLWTRTTTCKYILDGKFKEKDFQPYFDLNNFDVLLANRPLSLWDLLHYKQETLLKERAFQYVNIKNHIYYKALIVPLTDKTNLLETAKETSQWHQTKESNDTLWISGKKLFEFLQTNLKTKASEESMTYSYFFVNSYNKPIKNKKKCQKNQEKSLVLQAGCSYNKEEFHQGYIPFEKEQTLALFYLPLPLSIPDELSLRALFVYDWHE